MKIVKMLKHVSLGLAVVAVMVRPAFAQSRPLVTEDPETISAGQMSVEAGVDYQHGVTYPASGLTGNLWRIGTFGLDFGVSSIAEIQLSGGFHDQLAITGRQVAPLSFMLTGTAATGTTTGDVEDGIIGAKIRIAPETADRPSLAIRFATRLPNAGNESGLGLDTTDFDFTVLGGKTVRSVRVVGNFGFGILGDPTRGDSQNDVVLYGMSVARAVKQGVEVVAELNGRVSTRNNTPPPGTESRSIARLGTRYTIGSVRVDGALLFGLTDLDAGWGFSTGMTWVFHAFKVP